MMEFGLSFAKNYFCLKLKAYTMIVNNQKNMLSKT